MVIYFLLLDLTLESPPSRNRRRETRLKLRYFDHDRKYNYMQTAYARLRDNVAHMRVIAQSIERKHSISSVEK